MGGQPDKAASIFDAAVELGTAIERAAYLDAACGQDAQLRAEVEELLAHDEAAASFLNLSARPDLQAIVAESAVAECPGTVIGPYKLLEQIGEGGFGVVFMAEQQEPIRRKVALKVLKPGMDTRQVVARFEAERQALALMDHPNIAGVLDAGETATGRPYFVMELVKGVPITDYCDQNQLTPRERLELFGPVCQAMQHAHLKGIIHRDLKPSNILVTLHDGAPVVKVIDFGVAKAIGQQLTDKTLVTGFAQMIGTPLYMSPEQTAISAVDVDTRSDIYSLGVVLYELLTGTTPFDRERLREVGFDELRRIIREEEPPKPSTRISTLGQAAMTVSAQRKSDPKRLSQLFRGELDWIVMKALEKDRNRRYETASAFAADVQRYLADEPVLACPPSAVYRLRKFARRNRAALALALAVAVVVLLTVGGLTVNNILVTHERDLKQDALNKKEEALVLKDQALAQKDQALVEKQRQTDRANANLAKAHKAVQNYLLETAQDPRLEEADLLPLRKNLLATAVPFFEEFLQQKEGDPALDYDRARAYYMLALVREELDERQQALADYEQAQAIFARLVGDFPALPVERQLLAYSHNAAGNVFNKLAQLSEAEEAYGKALAIQEKLVKEFPRDPHYRLELAGTHNNLGMVFRDRKEPAKALTHFNHALALREKLADEFPKLPQCRRDLARTHMSLGVLLENLGQRPEAKAHYLLALDLQERLTKEFPGVRVYRGDLGSTHYNLGGVVQDPGEAEAHYRQALDIQRQLVRDFWSVPQYREHLAKSCNTLGLRLRRQGKRIEAEENLGQAVTLNESLANEFPSLAQYQNKLGGALHDLALLRTDQGQWKEARRLLEKAIVHQRTAFQENEKHTRYRLFLHNHYTLLAETLVQLGEHVEAAKVAAEPARLFPENWQEYHRAAVILSRCVFQAADDAKLSPAERGETAQTYAHRAKGLLREAAPRTKDDPDAQYQLAWLLANYPDSRLRDPALAVQLAESATENNKNESKAPKFFTTLGMAHYRAGDWPAAIRALERSMQLSKGGDPFAWLFLAMAHWQNGDKEQAHKWFKQAVEWIDQNKPRHEELPRYRAEAAELLGIEDKKD
jgi:serine/threonine protein kinase